ncbi:glutamine--tRNA ligase/YqeY domain fusion protein [Verrucomicrobiales bacterium]|jgi:glutaminyl-tRNA synthetase|nr:glutamine--tRNA ligase/YqeY domain fusion protein [Verrucomicrobiales bacterium]MDB2495681.1 glutamine--tRNA ligase/YqeY domain fusion protein [Verrucomicrobiales bacterium]
MSVSPTPSKDFIRELIDEDLSSGKHDSTVTRFPPEPNGYLHIGHAKSICLNFGIAEEYGGRCHLRFDDTNPTKEDVEYVDSIKEDIKWLGFDWGDHLYFASDYFEKLHEWAVHLIEEGKAYVDDQNAEEIRKGRGDLQNPGVDSPYRDRLVEENIDLFRRMKEGEFGEGEKVLRARIDMAHPNLNMRDPVIYRIVHAEHHRTGDTWCIYPMYDFTHGQSDALEYITHSLCTLEFENHRPLYDWFLDNLPVPSRPRQIEFGRLNLNYTVMSKRKLLQLVDEGMVSGWDDPRMPTISGIRRRGYPAEAIREFCKTIGITKFKGTNDISLLESAVRDVLNRDANRYMAVLNPIKLVITNYPEDKEEEFDAVINPEQPELGTRKVPFSRELYIERDDFMEDPPKKFFRLAPGKEVRFRSAYFIRCDEVVKDDDGNIVELRCTYDPETRGGQNPPDGRKVKATIHWVSAKHAVDAEVRVYDRLFANESPDSGEGNFLDHLNQDSLAVLKNAKLEPNLAGLETGTAVQFERLGYFCVDSDSEEDKLVFNRTVPLRDSWAKAQKKN